MIQIITSVCSSLQFYNTFKLFTAHCFDKTFSSFRFWVFFKPGLFMKTCRVSRKVCLFLFYLEVSFWISVIFLPPRHFFSVILGEPGLKQPIHNRLLPQNLLNTESLQALHAFPLCDFVERIYVPKRSQPISCLSDCNYFTWHTFFLPTLWYPYCVIWNMHAYRM